MRAPGQIMPLRYATLCSGIEAPSIAWDHLGWEPQFFSEIAAFPSAVLAQRWPHVPNLGDLLTIDGAAWRGEVDVLWASFPCQAFSRAGRRQGIKDARGALTLKGVELVNVIAPYFFCFENVKGILSDRDNAFGHFLAALVGEEGALEPPGGRWTHAGHVHGPKRSVAWRVMDAQHGGVAQQRGRVFLLGCPSHGASPQQILFEHEGCRRDAPPDAEAGQALPPLPALGAGEAVRVWPAFGQTARCLTAHPSRLDADSENFIVEIGASSFDDALTRREFASDETLRSAAGKIEARVRRLTPVECERLTGFPDDHTQVAWAGKPPGRCPDGVRYKAIGNSVAVPDVRWIGERIQDQVAAAARRHTIGSRPDLISGSASRSRASPRAAAA